MLSIGPHVRSSGDLGEHVPPQVAQGLAERAFPGELQKRSQEWLGPVRGRAHSGPSIFPLSRVTDPGSRQAGDTGVKYTLPSPPHSQGTSPGPGGTSLSGVCDSENRP